MLSTFRAFLGRETRFPPNLGDGWVMASSCDRRDSRYQFLSVQICKGKFGAGDRVRTGDVQLGKLFRPPRQKPRFVRIFLARRGLSAFRGFSGFHSFSPVFSSEP